MKFVFAVALVRILDYLIDACCKHDYEPHTMQWGNKTIVSPSSNYGHLTVPPIAVGENKCTKCGNIKILND